MNCRLLLTLILLAIFDCETAGKLIIKPRDTDIKVNHSTYFNCSTDIGSTTIFWFHGTNYVYIGETILEPYHERFRVDQNVWNGTYIYNLIINSVQPSDAGEYTCSDDEVFGEKYAVQLVVLDEDPTCRSNMELDEVVGQNTCNIEPDKVELECSVTYHGNIPPQMEWKKVGENSSTQLEVSVVTSRNHFVSTLKLKGDIVLNNSSYVCETKRTTQRPIKCTSKVIKILYALNDNSTVNKTINDEIHCNANTSQSCRYRWKWLQDNDYSIESSTSVLKARKPGWHRCEAECYLRNKTCNLLVMRAMVYGETDSNQTRNIIISVVVTVVVTLIVAFVLLVALVLASEAKDKAAAAKNVRSQQEDELKRITEHPVPPEKICGLAILDKELFISRQKRPDIEVYDSTTLNFKRIMAVDGMTAPENIVSCTVNNCLYASDSDYHGKLPAILRIDPTNGNLVNYWNIFGSGGLLSIARDTNVILTLEFEALLCEYTADGGLIRKINLSSGTDITDVQHAVKLNSGLFVVCHGEYRYPLSKVCLISIKESTSTASRIDEVEIQAIYDAESRKPINRLMQPMYLSVNKEDSILVSDKLNKQAVLLSSDLRELKILVSEEHEMKLPKRTCFDESTGQWFLVDDQRVMVCLVKDEGVERKCYTLSNEKTAENEGVTNERQYGGEKIGEDQVALTELPKEPENCGLTILDQKVFVSRLEHPDI